MVRKTNTKVPIKRKAKVKKDKESSLVFNCTSCAQPQLLVQGKRNILCHPQLQVGVCRECLIFAHADIIPLDDEGYEIYCRWCSELGNLVCCDECKTPFCEECISRNIGPEYYDSLMDVDEWKCFICEATAIESLRDLTKAALDHQNYNDPSDLLLEKCSAIFNGDADINDSDREEIVKERLRLRRNNLNETLNRKKKEKAAAAANAEKGSEESDEYVSEEDEPNKGIKEIVKKRKRVDSDSEYESSPESPKKIKDSDEDSMPPKKTKDSDDDSMPPKETKDSDEDSMPPKKTKDSDEDSMPSKKTKDSDEDSMPPKKAKDSDEDSMPPKKTKDSDEDSTPPKKTKDSDEESLPSVTVSDKVSAKQKKSSDEESAASNETLDLEKPSRKRARPRSRKGAKPKPADLKHSDISDSDSELLKEKRKSRKAKSYKLSLKKHKKGSTGSSSKSRGLRNPIKKPKYVSSDEKSEDSD